MTIILFKYCIFDNLTVHPSIKSLYLSVGLALLFWILNRKDWWSSVIQIDRLKMYSSAISLMTQRRFDQSSFIKTSFLVSKNKKKSTLREIQIQTNRYIFRSKVSFDHQFYLRTIFQSDSNVNTIIILMLMVSKKIIFETKKNVQILSLHRCHLLAHLHMIKLLVIRNKGQNFPTRKVTKRFNTKQL